MGGDSLANWKIGIVDRIGVDGSIELAAWKTGTSRRFIEHLLGTLVRV